MNLLYVVHSRTLDGPLKVRVYKNMQPVIEWITSFLKCTEEEMHLHCYESSPLYVKYARNSNSVRLYFSDDLTNL